MNNYLYKEDQKTYTVIILILIIPTLLILAVMLFPGWFGEDNSLVLNIFLAAVLILNLIILYNFYKLKIRLTNEELIFAFGWFKKKIPLKNIKSCSVQDYKFGRYGGYGIRIGWDKSIGYVARGGKGVRINTDKRDYFISTDNPEELYGILKNLLSK